MEHKEIWKDVRDYEGLYQVSNFGRIRSLARTTTSGKMRKPLKKHNGYFQISLYKDGFCKKHYIQRLVYTSFIGKIPEGLEINHKDGIKKNNFPSNLEYCTHLENHEHAQRFGLHAKGENQGMSKLTEWDVKIIRKLYKNTKYWASHICIAELFNVSRRCIGSIINNKTWKHVAI